LLSSMITRHVPDSCQMACRAASCRADDRVGMRKAGSSRVSSVITSRPLWGPS
jgi:hypothetical protein